MEIMPTVQLNSDKLSNVVRGNLVSFLGMNLTAELIATLTQQISVTVNDFFTKDDEALKIQ